jgi:hemoglobin-like flavoprotein
MFFDNFEDIYKKIAQENGIKFYTVEEILSKTPEQAIAEDWEAIGNDMKKVLTDLEKGIKTA